MTKTSRTDHLTSPGSVKVLNIEYICRIDADDLSGNTDKNPYGMGYGWKQGACIHRVRNQMPMGVDLSDSLSRFFNGLYIS
jgi:hypothetical protein